MGDIIIIYLLSQSLQIIHNHLEPMKHLRDALIILHLEACQLVLEDVQLSTLDRRCALIGLLQSLLKFIGIVKILDLLKHL